ncbi:MAG: biotin--[acetyl-CoA-carboxylase] ligase [Paludibacteraceae bacterium]|nr:biotin--[acetyl-CoA-carboxylase] ligase [Paludibacteraceae bacterium]
MYIDQTDSTNSLMQRLLKGEEQEYASCLKEDIPLIYTTYQTAGRGQTGNGWESERGKNLLLSYLLREPEVNISEMFLLNVIAAVAAHRTIAEWLSFEQRPMLSIKWPNDIYIGNRKIAGILVENSLSGTKIQHSIAGIGINVNQEQWVSGAPNPVSIKQLTGVKADIDAIVNRFKHKLETTLSWDPVQLRNYYRVHQYRCNGYWPFVEREVSTAPTMNATAGVEGQFMAKIEGFLPTGELLLRDQQGNQRKYHFKQVRYVL